MTRHILLLTSLLCCMGMAAQNEEKPSVLAGTVDEWTGEGYLLLFNPAAGRQSAYDTLHVDRKGRFKTTIALAKSSLRGLYLEYLGERRNVVYCYMKPGGRLHVTTRGRTAESIRGDGEVESRYINRPEFFGYTYQQPDGTATPYKDFRSAVALQQDTLRQMLVGAEEVFAAEKRPAIDEMQDNMLFVYNRRLARLGLNAWADADFRRAVRTFDLNDPDNLHRGLMTINTVEAINCRLQNEPALYADEPQEARPFCFIRDSIANAYVRTALPSHLLSQLINPKKPKRLERVLEVYHQTVGDTTLYDDMLRRYQECLASRLTPGQPAIDFEMLDTEGHQLMFSEVIGGGRLTYVDFWATWCSPCVAEIPHLERLVEALKDDSRVRFVSISLDDNLAKWHQKLAADKPAWPQYVVPEAFRSTFAREYQVTAIPQFMLFDAEGHIINLSAPRPSTIDPATYFNTYY